MDPGLIVGEGLNFHYHVDVRKAGAVAADLPRAKKCRIKDFMVALFVVHIRPILHYCSSV